MALAKYDYGHLPVISHLLLELAMVIYRDTIIVIKNTVVKLTFCKGSHFMVVYVIVDYTCVCVYKAVIYHNNYCH